MIPITVSDWYEEYTYSCKFNKVLPYNEQCAAWVDAMFFYESDLAAYTEIVNKDRAAAAKSNIGE
jgi:hypothetical protein